MGPGQHDVRRHRADRDRLVLDLGDVVVGGPVVRHQPGVGGDGTEHERVDLVLAEALDHLQPGAARRGVPPSTSTAPATSILPTPLRPAGTTTGSSLVREGMMVSSGAPEARTA